MKYIFPTLIILAVLIFVTACDPEDNFTTSNNDKLEFSLDTLRFDTVFTQLGSATRSFKIYNRSKKSIKIQRMYIPDGSASKFRLNVNGTPGNEATDVTIYPQDSIYVFGEVTVDPDQPLSASPFVIYDKILFETNGNEQEVTLEAWGQNANYIPSRFSKDEVVSLSCNGGDTIWDDPKPYVIYGIVVLENCTLTIPAGAHIYVHGGLSKVENMDDETVIFNSGRLQIASTATLKVEGTLEDPVIFEGDRLEEAFAEEEGQWTGIVFSPASKNNSFEHAIVKNSLLGIWVDSAAELSLKNTQIFNTSGLGLVGIHSEINAENCLFYNNNSTSVLLTYGGEYEFNYCTMASYGVDAAALSMANGIRFDEFSLCGDFVSNDLQANFKNCIIHGSRKDEISLLDFSPCGTVAFDYQFDNCIIKYTDLLDPEFGFPDFLDYCNNCLNATSSNALFASVSDDDYHLDTLSVAEEFALPIVGLTLDLEGKNRDSNQPDAGCYEYAPE